MQEDTTSMNLKQSTENDSIQDTLYSPLSSSKRDHKVKITEQAITKVPLIEYPNIPREQWTIIQELLKEVLRLSKDKNNSDEVCIVYNYFSLTDLDNIEKMYGVVLGDEHSVQPDGSTTSYHILNSSVDCVVIILHNHPSLLKISLQDIYYMLSYRSVKLMVAVTNLGSVTFVVKKDNYDKQKAIKLYKEAVAMELKSNTLKNKQEAVQYFLNECGIAGLYYGYK